MAMGTRGERRGEASADQAVRVYHVSKSYLAGRSAVDDVSFDLHAGRTLGLVGSSGCGKTTLARAILRLIPAQAGRVLLEGTSLLELSSGGLKAMRRKMQIVFQDPGGSLNERLRVGEIVGEPLLVHVWAWLLLFGTPQGVLFFCSNWEMNKQLMQN